MPDDQPQPTLISDRQRYRDALQWAYIRLSIDDGMTAKEQQLTASEIANVLFDRPTPAIDLWKKVIAGEDVRD